MSQSQTMPNFGGRPEIQKNQDGSISFRLKSPQGSISMTQHQVFPGISLTYNDIHIPRNTCYLDEARGNVIEIDHCRDGRLECCTSESSFYLAPGDLTLHQLGSGAREDIFPTGHYHGITIQIDLDSSPECMACFLDDVDVEPAAIANKFKLQENFFFAWRQLPSIEHIFSELYAVPLSIKKGYFKVKILELLLFLSGLEPDDTLLEQRKFSETQIILAKNVCSYLTEHINQRIPVQELSRQFGVPVSQINTSFKNVYGITIPNYMRGQRMQVASKLLRQTDRTVLDIAGELGYENGSKFAKAFCSVMGVTPSQYRNSLYHKK